MSAVLARRWPWALAAVVAGAATGAAAAYVAGRLGTQDAPGALDPEQVVAVVDRPEDH
jgi:membrane protein DedA with SNARE-associated domain